MSERKLNTFQKLSNFLGNKKEKKMYANTTVINVSNAEIAVKLHDTIIVRAFNNGKFFFDTGGFQTKTTIKRMNECSPFKIFQHKFKLYIAEYVEEKDKFSWSTYDFFDGMILDSPKTLPEYLRG